MKFLERLTKTLEHHGVVFSKRQGAELIGDCPFCGKLDHFYYNENKTLWSCKRCSLQGNVPQFLAKANEKYKQAFKENKRAQVELSKSRQLPISAFEAQGIGWSEEGEFYSIPYYSYDNDIVDVRVWQAGGKVRSTSGMKLGFWGLEQLKLADREEQVYVCEGEWDGVALRWLFRLLKLPGVVLAVPGAATFKQDWVSALKFKNVTLLYDADSAGEQGMVHSGKLLYPYAKSLRVVQWPPEVPTGWDVRDWIVYGAVRRGTPKKCWKVLSGLVVPIKEWAAWPDKKKGEAEKEEEVRSALQEMSREEMEKVYNKWLVIRDITVLPILLGSFLANVKVAGDPLWLFLVAPPGGMKSELIMSLGLVPEIVSRSSLTPHALVSGMQWGGKAGGDPSLIPQLDGKVLTIKDFTTTLSMPAMIRDEIFGQLRDIYDGKLEKHFGNGVVRNYESRFGLLAGVTPNIDAFSSLAGLGERFLKFRLRADRGEHQVEKLIRCLNNIGKEQSMRRELQEAAAAFLKKQVKEAQIPRVPEEYFKRLAATATVVAMCRGTVGREKFHEGLVTNTPYYEEGTRLTKQLAKLAMGVAMYYSEEQVGEREMEVMRTVARGTIPEKVEKVVHFLVRKGKPVITQVLYDSLKTKLTRSTVYRVCEDLTMLGLLIRGGSQNKLSWSLAPLFVEQAEISGVWK